MSDPVVEIPFFAGIDEATRDELVEPGHGWPVLENVRQDHNGAATKRPGYVAIAATRLDDTTRTAGRRQFARGDQIVTIDGTYLDVHSEALARSIIKGRVSEATARLRDAPSLGTNSSVEDVVVVNGFIVLSYYAPTLRHAAVVIDESSGSVVRGPEQVDAGGLNVFRLASYGNYAIALTGDVGAGEIRAKYVDTTSPTTVALGWQDIGTMSIDFGYGFDCACCASDDRVAIAFGTLSSSAERITVSTLNISGLIQTVDVATTNPITISGGSRVGLSENGSTLWLAYFDDLDVKVIGLDPSDLTVTLASVFTMTTFGAAFNPYSVHVVETGTGTANVYALAVDHTSNAVGYLMHVREIETTAGAAAAASVVVPLGGNKIRSRPFARGGRVYAHFDSGDLGFDGVLCDCTFPSAASEDFYLRPVAVAVQRPLHGESVSGRARAAAIDSNRYISPLVLTQGGNTSAARLAEYNFADPQRWHTATVNGSLCLGGGVASIFDGENVFEASFQVAPTMPQTDTSDSGGTNMTYGRRYVATFEHVDADGKWHTSGVSLPCGISGAQSSKVLKVRVPPCSITSRGYGMLLSLTSLKVVLYATLDDNNGEPPYYRVGSVGNDPYATVVEFVDRVVDSTLATNAQLYGTGNLPGTGAGQDHRAPPGLTHIVAYNGMIVGAAGRNIYYSSQPIDGEGQWFSPVFTQVVDEDVTGMATHDGAVYAFTRSHVYGLAGDPPSDNAATGGLGAPRRLSAPGCIDGNSIVSTPVGIVYQTDRGIEMLNQSGTSAWIGERIQDTLALFPVVSSAVYDVRANGVVRLTLAAASADGAVSGDGCDVLYFPTEDVWQSVDDKTGSAAHQASQDAALVTYGGVAGRYSWLGADGVVYLERLPGDTAEHLDGSTWVSQATESAWIKVAGLNGEQLLEQLLLLAQRHTDHDLSISLAFDYVESFGTPRVFTAAMISTLARQWLVTEITQTTSAAVKVRIEDADPSSGTVGTGKGATWIALTIAGRPQRGPKRSSAAQRGGS